jgi:uncharacterized protein YkwD
MRRTCIGLIAGTFLVVTAASAGAQDCAGTLAPAYPDPNGSADAIVCLVNKERAAQGLHLLSVSPALNQAAVDHTLDMVSHHFLAHTSPWRGGLLARIRGTGWLRGANRYKVGENLGYIDALAGTTPQHVVAMWMESPMHRANLLNPAFRSIGLAVSSGTPAGGEGSTVTAELGMRHFRRNLASKPVA